MSTTASASASARTQSEADELFRVASAEMAVTTCEVSSVGGGGGDRYAPLPHYQVEEVKKMWADVTEDDMAKLLAIPDRLEERRDDVVAEDAKLAKKAQKRARREGEDELAIVRGGGAWIGSCARSTPTYQRRRARLGPTRSARDWVRREARANSNQQTRTN